MKTTLQITLFSFTVLLLNVTGIGQMTIDNGTYSTTQLVDGVLVPAGSNTAVSNVSFRGCLNVSGRYQAGYFSTAGNTATEMGFANGVVLSTGNTADIPLTPGTNPGSVSQMSRNYTSGTSGEIRSSNAPAGQDSDVDNLLSHYNYYNAAILEFDFIPNSPDLSFRYIFGSEEYDQQDGAFSINYNCSSYNDKFAFLLSGPGISGGQGYANDAVNIARLYNNSEVGLNSVNDGVVGSSGGSPNASNCSNANPDWENGTPTAEFKGFIDGTELNGNTEILTAFYSGLTPGQTYHIRIMIADASDGAYDSVVYLEAESFTTDIILLPIDFLNFNGRCSTSGVYLSWATSSEQQNDYFIVERSTDGKTFKKINESQAVGNSLSMSNYSFTDHNATIGTNYYRLSQVDTDGKMTRLKTISVQNNCDNQSHSTNIFYQAQRNSIIVEMDDLSDSPIDIQLFNSIGQLVELSNVQRNSKESFEIELKSKPSKGLYHVVIIGSSSLTKEKILLN